MIAHGRWIDASSPYRKKFKISGNVSTDSLYWEQTATYLERMGVLTYEQDWLGGEAQADVNLNDSDDFMDNMAAACSKKGLTMQYCMPLPRHYLQTSKYDNVTSIRTSGDRFSREKWNEFLYASRLAGALGVWPWSDVTMSSEPENVLLSNLSAGPVGVGDAIGSLSRNTLLRVVRSDGVIVKPDVPMAPLDKVFIEEARGSDRPMVAATHTDFDGMKVFYIFAYSRGEDATATFEPSSLGLTTPVFVYDYFQKQGRIVQPGEAFSGFMKVGWAYYIAVPIGDSGIGFLGDEGQFVSLGKKRISRLADNGIVEATIVFAGGEKTRMLHGYSPYAPVIAATKGIAGKAAYDPLRHMFRVAVAPDADGAAVVEIRLASM